MPQEQIKQGKDGMYYTELVYSEEELKEIADEQNKQQLEVPQPGKKKERK